MTEIRLEDVSKIYPNGVTALRGVSVVVEPGQCLALVGPSGCGKTSLLRLVAGLEQPTGGTIRLGGQVINAVPAHHRGVAMVFQRPALLPGQTVRENLAWSWTLGGRGAWHLLRAFCGRPARTENQERDLCEIARLLGVDGLLDRRTTELSGGQQQRVALGRALLRRAPVCLLDEPLGHLEAALRTQLRRDLRLLSRRFPATMIHVTHDPTEALAIGDQVAVLHEGRLQQVGPPADVVRKPASRFVAEFCHPQGTLNFLEGPLIAEADDVLIGVAPWLRISVPPAVRSRLDGIDRLTLGVDGQDVKILPGASVVTPPIHTIGMDVILTEYALQGTWVTCRRDGVQVTGLQVGGTAAAVGSEVMVAITTDRAMWFAGNTGVNLGIPAG